MIHDSHEMLTSQEIQKNQTQSRMYKCLEAILFSSMIEWENLCVIMILFNVIHRKKNTFRNFACFDDFVSWLRPYYSLMIRLALLVRSLGVGRRVVLIISAGFVLWQVFIIVLERTEVHQLRVDFIFTLRVSLVDEGSWSWSTTIVGNFSILKVLVENTNKREGGTWFWLNSLLLCKLVTVVMVTTPFRLRLLSRTSYFFCLTWTIEMSVIFMLVLCTAMYYNILLDLSIWG